MTFALQYCHITVDDMNEAVAFYRDGLGFEVRSDVGGGQQQWVTLGDPVHGGPEIVLSSAYAGRSEAEGDALRELLVKGLLPMIVFSSDDLDADFERVRATGAEVLQEPIDRPYGVRDAAFRDPAGNTVRFHQPLKG
ncbi:VOC family protein [Nonomuraea sp. NPDC004580]|uniref:VOC family protein n=1 Tax=Nonomuraea sp. NPDC004580 TaxID=3154552 RepID=UPI0033A1ACF3